MTPTQLKQAQQILGLTNRQMAERFGLALSAYKDAKQGRTSINQEAASNIERAARRANGGR